MRHVLPKLLLLGALCILPVLGSLRLHDAGWPWLLPAVVYGVTSVVSFWHVRADKRRAGRGLRRTSERQLHVLGMMGGWPGSLVAQQRYRHKTRKVSFQMVSWLVVALHQLAWAAWIFRAHLAW